MAVLQRHFDLRSFGHDHSFTWGRDSNVGLIVATVLGDEIRRWTREQLENVGLSLVAQDDPQPAPFLVRLRLNCSMQLISLVDH